MVVWTWNVNMNDWGNCEQVTMSMNYWLLFQFLMVVWINDIHVNYLGYINTSEQEMLLWTIGVSVNVWCMC